LDPDKLKKSAEIGQPKRAIIEITEQKVTKDTERSYGDSSSILKTEKMEKKPVIGTKMTVTKMIVDEKFEESKKKVCIENLKFGVNTILMPGMNCLSRRF